MLRKLRPLFVVLLAVIFITNSVSAATIKSYSMTYYVDNEASRSMLQMINDWRTSGTAWYWEEGDSVKHQCGKLSAYTYDYNLEQIALQRAYEAAVSFSHTRPDGTDCFTCKYNSTKSYGECICFGSPTAQDAFELWQEEDYGYDEQGHRRAMLDKDYKAIGIAHVVLDDTHYWVQEYGFSNSGASTTTAIKGNKTGTVAMDVSQATFYIYEESYISNMTYGATQTLPAVKGAYKLSSTYGSAGLTVPDSELTNVTWTSSNQSVIKVENNKTLRAVGAGSCTLTANATFGGKTYTISMNKSVSKIQLSNSGITATVPSCYFSLNGNTPKPVLTYNGTALVEGTDYDITSYSYNTSVTKSASVKVTGKGNFSGTKSITFEIMAYDINNCTLSSIPSATYTGNAITPSVTLTQSGKTLTQGTHFTVSCTNNTNPGTATVTITGKGNFTGERTSTFTISKQSVNNLTISSISDQKYTGSAITPSVTVKNGSKTLVKDTDYTITYSNNIEPGTASATITCKGNYTGSKTVNFTIIPKQMSEVSCSYTSTFYYTGSRITPDVTVKSGSYVLTEGTDYTVSYSNNTNVGTAKITLTGIGTHFTGTKDLTFQIKPITVSMATFTVKGTYTYTGSAITPSFTLKYGDITFKEGVDYSVTYSNNIEPGSGEASITGISTILTGTAKKYFSIGRISISSLTVDAVPSQTYTGSAIEPDVVIKDGSKTLVKGTDYTLSYYNNTSVTGSARITITGINHYTGTRYEYFSIVAKSISDASVNAVSAQTYTGSAIKPQVTVKYNGTTLTLNTDYTVSYSNNTNAGTAKIVITGKGTYSGSKTVNFTINAKSISSATVSSIADQAYTGSAVKPAVTVTDGSKTLVSGTDYTVSYSNNVNVGTAEATITGKGNYSGTKTVSFNITGRSISGATISAIADQVFTGSTIKPTVTVKYNGTALTLNTDYTVSYSNNTNAGTAKVTVTGKGSYSGTKTASFKILPNSSELTVLSIADWTYTGSAITPVIAVKAGSKTLVSGTDYTYSFSDNINAGTATVTVTGKGNYSGTGTGTFKIVPKAISGMTISSIEDQTYTGSPITPSVTVTDGSKTLTEGTDYTVTYANNIDEGTATVSITGIGNYSRTRSVTFVIVRSSEPEKPDYTWEKIDGKWYLFDKNGSKVTGLVEVSGSTYYLDTTGVMQTGWIRLEGDWYYFAPGGQRQTGWVKTGGSWYYLDEDGKMLKDWQKIGGVWYFLGQSGIMRTGWQQIGNIWYYFESSGAMVTGWKQISGNWYYFDGSGAMKTGWLYTGGNWYYLNSSGSMATGWVQSGGKWYRFGSDGAMLYSTSVELNGKVYEFDANGVCTNP